MQVVNNAVIPMLLPLYCDRCRRAGRSVLQQLPIPVAEAPRLRHLRYAMTSVLVLLALPKNSIQLHNFVRRYRRVMHTACCADLQQTETTTLKPDSS